GMQAEITQVMFDSEADVILNDFGYRLQMQGISLDQYVRMQGMDLPSFRKVFLPQAERQVKVRLALRKIVELENIEVSEEDLNAEYAKLAERYGMEDAQIRAAVTADAVTDDLKLNRALAVIKDSAKVKKATRKKKAEEAPADAPAEETAAE
ncbi:MAG: trigger factor, partial [Eubacteriales bacterium]|nr:trigger factor [Eubacteriales bacterium]